MSFEEASLSRLILDATPVGMLVVNEAGRIVFANPQVAIMHGWTRPELVGQALSVLIPERLRAAHKHYEKAFNANRSTRNGTDTPP